MGNLIFSLVLGVITGIAVAGFVYWLVNLYEVNKPYEPIRKVVYRIYGETEEYCIEQQKIADKNYEQKLKEYNKELKKYKRRTIVQFLVPIITLIIITAGACTLYYTAFAYHDSMEYKEDLASFEAQKQTIEQAISNESLGGLERIELVNQASELNAWLAEEKIKLTKWSKFDIYQEVKDLYANAEYISLE